jgi:glycosyltransferase involved in cell wall biosynthesis
MSFASADARSLKIVHVLRAPLGGLFRHVLDLTREQIARGHRVGLITDSLTGGERAAQILNELSGSLALGLQRMPMYRNPAPNDLRNLLAIGKAAANLAPDVIHGHGSKGGLYARLPHLFGAAGGAIRAYTPHGGSFNYKPGSTIHRFYMMAEGVLERATDLYLFESAFIQGCFENYVGRTSKIKRVVLNGISDAEFEILEPAQDAADFLYVGELRSAKGIDTLIDAMAIARDRSGRRQKAVLVGSGPDQEKLTQQARALKLEKDIFFPGAMPARDAFRLGKILLVPSRAESLPYVVLEAAGAGVPMVSTNVGGIPEIFGSHANRLIPCNDPQRLAETMLNMQMRSEQQRRNEAMDVRAFVQSKFHISDMADAVIEGYRDALRRKHNSPEAVRQPLAASS